MSQTPVPPPLGPDGERLEPARPRLMISVSGVRGIVGAHFNPLVVGRWTAALAEILPPGPVVVGRDSRTTGEVLARAASAVFQSTGREVWDVGIVPTPTVQIAVEHWGASGGLILSASHNPAPWNACKFVDSDGSFLSPDRFERLRASLDSGSAPFAPASDYGKAVDRHAEALRLHLDAILRAVDVDLIRKGKMRVLLDTGHGAGGVFLPSLAEELGVELIGRNLEPNGEFAANPEPSIQALKELVKSAPPGVAFVAMVDPDADRFALALPAATPVAPENAPPLSPPEDVSATPSGSAPSSSSGDQPNPDDAVLGEEWTLPLVAFSLLSQTPGHVITNLSTSSRMEAAAALLGSEVTRTPVGEAHVVGAMKRLAAAGQPVRLGGEGNGGVIDPAVHLGRDSGVAFARLCEAHARFPGGLRALAARFPTRVMTKEKLAVSSDALSAAEPELISLLGPVDDRRDGLRWSRPGGFVHIRASNTEPIVRILVEADSSAGAEELTSQLRSVLGSTGRS